MYKEKELTLKGIDALLEKFQKLEELKDRYEKEDFAYRGILEKVIEIVRKGGAE